MERYTRLFTNGEAYINIRELRVVRSGEQVKIAGDPIQRFALYEASGYEPAEILMMLRELEDYRKTGFMPAQLARIFKGVPIPRERGCPGQLSLE